MSGRSWPFQSWVRYLQSQPALANVIDWSWPLTFLVRGDAYRCAGGSWTQLSVGILNHGARGRSPAYLWVIGMAVCGDSDMAALATIWAENVQVCAHSLFVNFCVHIYVSTSRFLLILTQFVNSNLVLTRSY